MLLPVLGITLPDVATRDQVATLLDACDQAFLDGDCVEADAQDTTAELELVGEVVWLSETEAQVRVGRASESGSDSEQLSFGAQDDAVERYRALGFTIGSLASSFLVGQSEPPAPVETAPPLVPPEPEVRIRDEHPDPLLDRQPDPPSEPLDPALGRSLAELGLLVGNGFGQPRVGMELSFGAPLFGRWAGQLWFSAATQTAHDSGIEASFFAAGAFVGPRFRIEDVVLTTGIGVAAQQLRGALGEARLNRSRPAFGPLVAVHARVLDARFSPFLGLRASYLEPTAFALEASSAGGRSPVSENLGQFGPWQLEACLGVSLSLRR